MKTSLKGMAELAGHEGIVTGAYVDSVGVKTIGIGHTAAAGSPIPRLGMTISVGEAIETFGNDLRKYESDVSEAFHGAKLTQEQFDAAVSFHYNTGAIKRASWVKSFIAGDKEGARRKIMDWRKPKEIIPRRQKERDLFFNGKYSNGGMANIYPASSSGGILWKRGKRVNIIDMLSGETYMESAKQPADSTESTTSKKTNTTATGVAVTAVGITVAGLLASVFDNMKDWLASLPIVGGLF